LLGLNPKNKVVLQLPNVGVVLVPFVAFLSEGYKKMLSKKTMSLGKSMTFRIIFQEFCGLSKHHLPAYTEEKSGSINVSFIDEGNAVNEDF
jgi:hypothetical protein